jgi:hypothetical protein
MQADFAVELGRDDETLEIPWAAPDSELRYYDLKRQAEAISRVPEAAHFPELRDFLVVVNSPTSLLETAKCDAWSTTEINPEEEIFAAPHKFGGYVDFILSDTASRFCFDRHQDLLKRLTALFKRAPDIPASAEFFLRRCYYHEGHNVRDGFYVTLYLFGYGNDEAKARQQWGIALELAGNAITQLCSRHSSLS